MARARNIKPGFFSNDELALCEHGARLLFVGLWTIADRMGRLEDRPEKIRVLIFPYDTPLKSSQVNSKPVPNKELVFSDIHGWLAQLAEHGFITRYEVANRKYIQINTFNKHQTPHVKEPESTLPAQDSSGAKTVDCGLRIPDTGYMNPDTGSPVKARTAKFAPPSLDEVKAYCLERENGIDPELFIAHYEACGWVYGKSSKPVKSWKACVITWEKDPRNKKPQSRIPTMDELKDWNASDGGSVLRGAT